MTTTPSPELVHALEHWFDEDAPVAPSVSFALFDRAGILLHRSLGEHSLDGRPPALDTVYRIASMSKSVEAAAVLVLRDRGLLSLEDPVSAHVAEFTDPVGSTVTLRMLLSNRSGLPEDNAWADHVIGMGREEFLALVARGLAFTERPGEVYQYSNVGFWLLGIMVENVSGQRFEDFARSELLEPLGLTATRYDVSDYADDGVGAGLAQGFSTYDDGATWVRRAFVGSGVGSCAASLFSTLPDIARWSAWLSSAFDGTVADPDDDVLSRSSRREMQTGSTLLPSLRERSPEVTIETAAYGLGLVVEHDARFGPIAHHSGGLPGWSSNMRWHLASGVGVAVFANANGVKAGPVAAALLRRALEDAEAPAREIPLLASTVSAAEAVESAIVAGDLLEAEHLFSPNLLSDVPADVRADRLSTSVAAVGGLTERSGWAPLSSRLLWSASAAHVAFALPGADGDLECRIEATPTVPAMIQRLDIAQREPATGREPVARHYRPTVTSDDDAGVGRAD